MARLTGTPKTFWTEENLTGMLMLAIGLVALPVHAKILVMMLTHPPSYSWLQWWPLVLVASGLSVLISETRFQKRSRK